MGKYGLTSGQKEPNFKNRRFVVSNRRKSAQKSTLVMRLGLHTLFSKVKRGFFSIGGLIKQLERTLNLFLKNSSRLMDYLFLKKKLGTLNVITLTIPISIASCTHFSTKYDTVELHYSRKNGRRKSFYYIGFFYYFGFLCCSRKLTMWRRRGILEQFISILKKCSHIVRN